MCVKLLRRKHLLYLRVRHDLLVCFFFPQVVVLEGMNTTGRKLMASKLYEVHY